MAKVTLAANEDIWDLLDDEYIQDYLGDLNVNILFSCVNTNKWSDDSWVEKDGTPYHIIKLPYDLVNIHIFSFVFQRGQMPKFYRVSRYAILAV